ncbi:hypothetical protein CU044_0521 [Streptomyces sp. L-9-10]|nr:hypothetical protein CU044_0521 [Streptomyces sp. L-9-10]
MGGTSRRHQEIHSPPPIRLADHRPGFTTAERLQHVGEAAAVIRVDPHGIESASRFTELKSGGRNPIDVT